MSKKKIPPLIVEYLNDTSNLHFISLIEYRREHHIGIIDNITDTELTAFILNHAKSDQINMDNFLKFVVRWFYQSSHKYPLSFEFAKLGMSKTIQPMVKNFELNYVSRIVGKPFVFENLNVATKIKRRRVIDVPDYVEIQFKKSNDTSAD